MCIEHSLYTHALLAVVAVFNLWCTRRSNAALPPTSSYYLVVDTETTGLDTEEDRVVSVAASLARHDASGKVHVRCSYYAVIKPDGFKIPLEATSIHGITTEHAIAVGVPLSEAKTAIQALAKQADYIVAYNAEFDRKMLERENIVLEKPWKCAALEVKSQVGRFIRLQLAYSLAFPTAFAVDWHNAECDVQATLKLWAFLSHNRMPPIPKRTRKTSSNARICGRLCKNGSLCKMPVTQRGDACRWHRSEDDA